MFAEWNQQEYWQTQKLAAGWPDVQVESYLYLLGAARSPRLLLGSSIEKQW